jgi:hypothetical protein
MFHDVLGNQLNLLVPWELPVELELSQINQVRIKKALTELLQAITESDVQQGIVMLENAITDLEVYDAFTPQVDSTNTTLKYWEVEDFDTYFYVRHVQTLEPELCLVHGLLLACQAFLYLSQEDSSLIDINQLELQREGFKSSAYLIGRVFHLNLE